MRLPARWFFALLSLLVAFSAFAQLPPAVEEDPDGLLRDFIAAVQGGNWRVAVVVGAVGVVYLLRKVGVKIPGKVGVFLASSRGGAVLALLASILGALGAALAGQVPLTGKLVLDAFLLGFTAIGGWVGVRRLLGLDFPGQAATVYQPLVPAPGAAAAAGELGKPVG